MITRPSRRKGYETLLACVTLLMLLTSQVGCALFRFPSLLERQKANDENGTWMRQHMAELFPTRTISRKGAISSFEDRPVDLLPLRFAQGEESTSIEEFLTANETAGIVVLHQGKRVFEHYGLDADETTRFTSWSVAKSFTSTLVGLAVGEGLIESVDDPLGRYLPQAQGTAYENVTIAQALQMSSGVGFSEEYDPISGSDVVDFMTDSLFLNSKRANEAAIDYPTLHEPGTVYNYNTAESQVLGLLVREVTGKSPSAYLQEKIWGPLGMEHDATWILDLEGPTGMEFGGCCLNMALRDWARFGQLVLQDGVWDGERILPEGWVAAATRPDADAEHLNWGAPHPFAEHGYQYQWWSIGTGAFSAEGVHGQFIYVDPKREVVIAKASSWPEAWIDGHGEAAFAAFDAIARHLAGE